MAKYKKDLFGNEIEYNALLRDRFIEPPFTILDTKSGSWRQRKNDWKALGFRSEVGRDGTTPLYYPETNTFTGKRMKQIGANFSIFDPALAEVLYHWFCPEGGSILDPFAGGSVRGIVANYLGFNYTGIDIRKEQIESNKEQAEEILPKGNQPKYYIGDSNTVLDKMKKKKFDLVFSCPPYADLETYSDLPNDISNMEYHDFMVAYESIIKKSCALLKDDGYACFVVGEIRDKDGNYRGFLPDTINAFTEAGVYFYNEAILLNAIGSACLKAGRQMRNKKLVKIHQNILVFRKSKKNQKKG